MYKNEIVIEDKRIKEIKREIAEDLRKFILNEINNLKKQLLEKNPYMSFL